MKYGYKHWAIALPVSFIATFLLSSANLPFGLSPFYLAVFVSCVSYERRFLLPALVFLGATALRDLCFSPFSLPYFLQMLFAAAGVGLGALIQRLRRKRYHGFYAVLLAFFGQLFTIFFLPRASLYTFLLNVALGAFFALVTCRLFGAKRARIFLFTNVEKVLAMLCVFALGAGAYSVSGHGVTPFYLLLAAAVPLLSFLGAEGAAYSLAFAFGAITAGGEGILLLPVALAILLTEILKGKRRVAAFSVLFSEICAFFLYKGLFSPYNFILIFTGGLFASLLPNETYRKLVVHFGRGEDISARSVVNKTRLDLSGKLGCMSDALRKMAGSLQFLSMPPDAEDGSARIAFALSRGLCEGCKGLRDCARQAGGNTAELFLPTVSRAVEQGRASIMDVSPYLNANCHKIKALLDGLNDKIAAYEEERSRADALKEERNVMASEAEGIAGVLDAMRKETRRVVTFDGSRERRIVRELAAEGITAYDAMVTEDGDYLGVTVTMPESDAEDPHAAKAVSRAMGVPLLTESIGMLGAGTVSVNYETAPYYDVIVGEAVGLKEGSEVCGDVKSVTRLGADKVMVALSDGMGSGRAAGEGSSAAIALVENFYKTGVDEKVLLPLINRLLTVRNDGSFQTLDMCVIHLRTGEADFIKLSAPESVIKRKGGHEIVEGSALPLGILREVRPSISRKKLSSGDLVVLMTDGVTDAIGADGVIRVLEGGRTYHPRTVAENILQDASYVSSADDRTVVALRLYRRLEE